MRKTQNNLILLSMLFAVSLIIANVVTGKLFATGLTIMGVEITLPGAVLCYAITFLITDIVGEVWGKKEANQIVVFGVISQILATVLIIGTQYVPAASQEAQAAYELLLGQNWVFVLGSLIAYLCSQAWDVWIFHKIRDKYIEKHGSTKGGRWIWNNASTGTSQIIDTVVFTLISFGLGMGWLFDAHGRKMLIAMMTGQYLYKLMLALLDTPVFYIFTRKSKT